MEVKYAQASFSTGWRFKPATTYYWRVDTVLEDATVITDIVWLFTVFARSETPIVVENFEKLDIGALGFNGDGPRQVPYSSHF